MTERENKKERGGETLGVLNPTHVATGRNRQTDRQTDIPYIHTYKPSTVTLVAHACRRLIRKRERLGSGVLFTAM